MSRNSAIGETTLVASVVAQLRGALPANWTVDVASEPSRALETIADGVLTIAAPGGTTLTLALEVKPLTGGAANATVDSIVRQAERLRTASRLEVVIITEYANPALRAACATRGIGYADTTGWIRLESRKPALFVNTQGAARPARAPQRTAITRLNGTGAARVVATLLSADPPVGVRQLAAAAKVSPGSVAKVLPTLALAGAVERDKGAVVLIRRRLLLDRWTQDYSFIRSNRQVTWWLAARGIERALTRMAPALDVVATGSLVSRRWLPVGVLPVTPLTLAALYVADTSEAALALGLVPAAQAEANFVLAVPRDEQLLSVGAADGPWPREVPLARALADLLTLPGRSIEEAEQVLGVLSTNDATWLPEVESE